MAASSGFILIDKPEGLTSLTVGRRLKRILSVEHIGHLGTLDPFASGLLPVMVGGATRLADLAHEGLKEYRFSVRLGSETDTLDPQGKVVAEAPILETVLSAIPDLLTQFKGEIRQIPPAYSAIKMNGVALYEYMRSKRGTLPLDIETKARSVLIEELDYLGCREESGAGLELDFRVLCGKGTYVRSLARDLALGLGTRGYCSRLRRTRIGAWTIGDATPFATSSGEIEGETAFAAIRPPEELVPHLPILTLDLEYRRLFVAGNCCLVRNGIQVVREAGAPLDRLSSLALVSCDGIQFLCEIRNLGNRDTLEAVGLWEGPLEVQPRKRIC